MNNRDRLIVNALEEELNSGRDKPEVVVLWLKERIKELRTYNG